MIKVEKVSRSYGDFLAVDRVSFDIAAGEIVGLLGHNGAGKTTIMRMLSGCLEPCAGGIAIAGIELAEDAQAARQVLGYLPESLPGYPDMSVADYLDYAATLKGLAGEERRQSLRRAIADTELGEKLLDRISTLSRGYKQRVGVAQAIIGAPKVLILDEPTNGLDPSQTQHMRELISSIAKNATIILSTHIMQEVDAICHRALILNNGRLALDERLDVLRASHALLLRSSLDGGAQSQLAGEIDGVARREKTGAAGQTRLALRAGADPDEVAARVAAKVAEAGGRLYQLQPETRDLEAVFREVNNPGGLAHAA